MNKSELLEAVAAKANMSKKSAEGCLSAFVDVVSDTLASGDKVQWTGFERLSLSTGQQGKA